MAHPKLLGPVRAVPLLGKGFSWFACWHILAIWPSDSCLLFAYPKDFSTYVFIVRHSWRLKSTGPSLSNPSCYCLFIYNFYVYYIVYTTPCTKINNLFFVFILGDFEKFDAHATRAAMATSLRLSNSPSPPSHPAILLSGSTVWRVRRRSNTRSSVYKTDGVPLGHGPRIAHCANSESVAYELVSSARFWNKLLALGYTELWVQLPGALVCALIPQEEIPFIFWLFTINAFVPFYLINIITVFRLAFTYDYLIIPILKKIHTFGEIYCRSKLSKKRFFWFFGEKYLFLQQAQHCDTHPLSSWTRPDTWAHFLLHYFKSNFHGIQL